MEPDRRPPDDFDIVSELCSSPKEFFLGPINIVFHETNQMPEAPISVDKIYCDNSSRLRHSNCLTDHFSPVPFSHPEPVLFAKRGTERDDIFEALFPKAEISSVCSDKFARCSVFSIQL